MKGGCVVWITGLPGVGKTCVATALFQQLRERGVQSVWLDGDEMRRELWPDAGYDELARRRLAAAYARLAVSLAQQDTVVVVSVVALFASVREWLSDHAPAYLEVLVQCPESARIARIPAIGRRGLEVGRELSAEMPLRPDLVIDNDAGRECIPTYARRIAACLDVRQAV